MAAAIEELGSNYIVLPYGRNHIRSYIYTHARAIRPGERTRMGHSSVLVDPLLDRYRSAMDHINLIRVETIWEPADTI
jgi:hypothetical protein